MIADMATEIEAARLLVYRAAWKKDNGLPYGQAAAMAKLFASETATRVAGKAIQIHGGYGFTESYPVERAYRDAKVTETLRGHVRSSAHGHRRKSPAIVVRAAREWNQMKDLALKELAFADIKVGDSASIIDDCDGRPTSRSSRR